LKSLVLKLVVVLTVLTLLVACGNEDSSNNANQNQENNNSTNETIEKQEETTITVTLTKDKEAETLEEKEVVIEEGDILLDVMKENFDIEEKEPGYILSIDGTKADEAESMFWALSVNGEMSGVGAAEVELKNGDIVNFDLQSWE
jgi:major membrane immunogen (membrane-anchored lipoprotein)